MNNSETYVCQVFRKQVDDILFVSYIAQRHILLNSKCCSCIQINLRSDFSSLCSFILVMAFCCWCLRVSIKHHNNIVSKVLCNIVSAQVSNLLKRGLFFSSSPSCKLSYCHQEYIEIHY